MTTRERMILAGDKLRILREDQKLTQKEIEAMTARRFGDENRVYAQQVSRIEKGQLDKPPILDLLRFGQVLGLTPDDIAEYYGLWPRQKGSRSLDPRLQAAIDLTEELSGMERESFLNWVQFATLQARAEQRTREAHGSPDPATQPSNNQAPEGNPTRRKAAALR